MRAVRDENLDNREFCAKARCAASSLGLVTSQGLSSKRYSRSGCGGLKDQRANRTWSHAKAGRDKDI